MPDTLKNEPKINPREVLDGIVESVTIESPSHDARAVNVVVDKVEGQFSATSASRSSARRASTASATSWNAGRRRR